MDVPSDILPDMNHKRKRSLSSALSESDESFDLTGTSETDCSWDYSLDSSVVTTETETEVSEPETPASEKRTSPIIRDEFLRYRRMEPTHDSTNLDFFSTLPDEVVLNIMSYLNYKNLINVALVCKRMRQIVMDETLWPRLDVSKRQLRPGHVDVILSRGVRILRMYATNFLTPIFPSVHHYIAKVEYLDLSQATILPQDLLQLLQKLRNLKKLSLDMLEVDNQIMKEISKNKNLDTLNLNMCSGIRDEGLKAVAKGCQKLLSLNIAWSKLDDKAITELVNRVSPELTEINISGHPETLEDKHVVKLVSRCSKITYLDVSDCIVLTEAALCAVVENLFRLEVISLSRCYKISPLYLLELRSLPNLKRINAFLLIVNSNRKVIEQVMPKVILNADLMSPVARPCTGIRRTSIWRMKVRD